MCFRGVLGDSRCILRGLLESQGRFGGAYRRKLALSVMHSQVHTVFKMVPEGLGSVIMILGGFRGYQAVSGSTSGELRGFHGVPGGFTGISRTFQVVSGAFYGP